MGQKAIFLYFEGEWRMGPSPEQGSVWAYARSDATSPLLINAPWEVWDGKRVVQDAQLRVSDTSVIPSVLFVSFGAAEGETAIPRALQGAEGMLLQQPGLWDGRPYYRHTTREDIFLLCSVAEGHWRLGPLPLMGNFPGRPGGSWAGILFARSAAALPQEIAHESWHARANETSEPTLLGEGVVRLSATSGAVGAGGGNLAPRYHHPRHIVVEGVRAGNGAANGVYRRSQEVLNQRPVYHKTDALRAASLWFAGADWRLGASTESNNVWAYAASVALSPLVLEAPWQQLDGREDQGARILDASSSIPGAVTVAGEHYVQQPRLCDARPVYQRSTAQESDAPEVFLFFRAHESEWWLGPAVGGTECYAKAAGSLLQVVPDVESLVWRLALQQRPQQAQGLEAAAHDASAEDGRSSSSPTALDGEELHAMASTFGMLHADIVRQWCGMALTTLVLLYGAYQVVFSPTTGLACTAATAAETEQTRSSSRAVKRKSSALVACVVCLEAPREILLLPCRHVCCCKACADRLEHCPMCRAKKTAFAKVFL